MKQICGLIALCVFMLLLAFDASAGPATPSMFNQRTGGTAAGNATPAGSNGDIQINSSGTLGALTPGSGMSTFLTESVDNSSYMFLGNAGNGSTASENLGVGGRALDNSLTSGTLNTAVGFFAGYQVSAGDHNTAVGAEALYTLQNDSNATAVGYNASHALSTGADSTAVGSGACNVASATQATCIGSGAAPTSGTANNVSMGYQASATVSNEVKIGNASVNQLRIGSYAILLATKFTISGCSAGTTHGTGLAGDFASGTTGTCTVVITINGATGYTAPTGYTCWSNDLTTPADVIHQTASSTTTVTLEGTTVSGDVINFGCVPY